MAMPAITQKLFDIKQQNADQFKQSNQQQPVDPFIHQLMMLLRRQELPGDLGFDSSGTAVSAGGFGGLFGGELGGGGPPIPIPPIPPIIGDIPGPPPFISPVNNPFPINAGNPNFISPAYPSSQFYPGALRNVQALEASKRGGGISL